MSAENVTKLDFAVGLEFDQILTNPILDIAARFWDEDRYHAFRVCYRSMRRIDDLVDNRKKSGYLISDDEAAQYARIFHKWLGSVRQGNGIDSLQEEFIETLDKFALPLWPWERLCRAMVYDLKHDGYRSFPVFLRYADGAAVAPAAIFMHLCGVAEHDGGYVKPMYDIRRAARPLALFSYLVHIIRDFQKDQQSNLNYFSDDLLQQYSLNVKKLREIAKGGKIESSFRSLMERYQSFAEYYRRQARQRIVEIAPLLSPRYQLSLEVIYSLYSQIFERIDPVAARL